MPANQFILFENIKYELNDFVDHACTVSGNEEDWKNEIFNFVKYWFDNENCIQIQSSGSTGMPKFIEFTKQQLKTSAWQTARYFNLKKGDTALLCLPARFIAGKMMLARAFEVGMNLIIVKPNSSPAINQAIDFAAMTPHQVQTSIANNTDLASIKKLLIGGEAIQSELLLKIKQMKTACYASYGMTETITHIAIQSLNAPFLPYFETLPNIDVSTTEQDCLTITAPYLKERIVTTDIVEITGKGKFVWKGRIDNVINSGGVKIIPELVELKIKSIISEQIIICGIPDRLLGQKVVLLIERNSMTKEESDVIFKRIKQILSKYELPKELRALSQFVYTENGKVNRNQTIKLIII